MTNVVNLDEERKRRRPKSSGVKLGEPIANGMIQVVTPTGVNVVITGVSGFGFDRAT